MRNAEIVYQGRDNHIELELLENNVEITDYVPITRIKLTVGADTIDSDSNPELFDWTGGKVVIKAGLAGLSTGRFKARLETWDPDNTNGVVWTDELLIHVKA